MSLNNAGNILGSLGITAETANKNIVTNLTGLDVFKLPYLKMAPAILTGDKTAAAKDVCTYIKSYCESSTFAADYAKYRQSEKPTEEDPASLDAESIKELKEAAITWDELAKNKNLPQIQRDEYLAMADDARKTVARSEDPTPKLTEWKKNFPEDPSGLVKRGLRDYLTLVKTVDFNAQLTQPDEYKIRKFVKPEYEAKSYQWKAIFRAGREVNDVAANFA